jgi:hypothetical protein
MVFSGHAVPRAAETRDLACADGPYAGALLWKPSAPQTVETAPQIARASRRSSSVEPGPPVDADQVHLSHVVVIPIDMDRAVITAAGRAYQHHLKRAISSAQSPEAYAMG